jgi:hypothetical protein
MTIETHTPELDELVQQEIQSGHFENVDDLLTQAIHALREKEANAAFKSGKPLRVVGTLMSAPFANSELYIPPRQKDFPRPFDL